MSRVPQIVAFAREAFELGLRPEDAWDMAARRADCSSGTLQTAEAIFFTLVKLHYARRVSPAR